MSSKKVRGSSPVRLRKIAVNNLLSGVPQDEIPTKLKEELQRVTSELCSASTFDPNINKNNEILMHILSLNEFNVGDVENEQLLYKLLSSNVRVEAKCAIVKKLIGNNVEVERLVRSIWGDYKSKDQLRKVFMKLSCENELFHWLWMEHLIPLIYESAMDNNLKVVLGEALLECCPNVKLSDFGEVETKLFLDKKLPEYCKALDDIRLEKVKGWHFLWRLLIKFCGICLHSRTDCLNRLLSVMESAFRNEAIEERLTAFNCWKELIDNFSLNKNHVVNSKQLNLLLTPLKARFTTREVVILKRFEVFIYLLNKLEEKATHVLPEFLEFCFGPLRVESDPKKVGQAKIPSLIKQTARSLLRIISKRTSPTRDKNIIKQPIITTENFGIFSNLIINSVEEATDLLLTHEKDYRYISNIWEALMNMIIQIDDDSVKYTSFKAIQSIFKKYLEQAKNSPGNNDENDKIKLISTLISILTESDLSKILPYLFETFLEMLLVSDHQLEEVNLRKLLDYSFTSNENEILLSLLDANNKSSAKHVNFLSSIWKAIAQSLNSTMPYFITDINQFWTFFLWPCFYLNKCSESDITEIKNLWTTSLYNLYETKEPILNHCHPITKLHSVFKENPLLANNICVFLKNTDLNSILRDVNYKELIEFIRELLILGKPSILDIIENILIVIVHSDVIKTFDFSKVVKDICPILIDILKIRVNHNFVSDFKTNLLNLNTKQLGEFKKLLNKSLTNVINSKTSEDDVKLLKDLFNSLGKSKNAKVDETSSNRLSKIMNMCPSSNLSHKEDYKHTVETQTNNLCIFGSSLHSPLGKRGSLMANIAKKSPQNSPKSTTPKSEKKKRTIDEENSQDFVPIDSAVKFDLHKLSEHQREVLKRRREDIPALYEDLSQSQSQDLFALKDKDTESSQDIKNVETETKCEEITTEIELKDEILEESPKSNLVENTEEKSNEFLIKTEEQDIKDNKDLNLLSEGFKQIDSDNLKDSQNSTKENQKTVPRRSYIQNELKKIQLDCVGADEFLNVQSRRGRRSLRRLEEDEEAQSEKLKQRKKGDGKKGKIKTVVEDKVVESRESQMDSKDLPNALNETENIKIETENSVEKLDVKITPDADSLENSAENRQLAEMLSPPSTPRKRGRPKKMLNAENEPMQNTQNFQTGDKELNMSIDRLLVEGLTSTQNSQNNTNEKVISPVAEITTLPKKDKQLEIADSEEIIESSQESLMDTTKTSPRRRSKNDSKLKIIQKKTIENYFDETTKTVNESDLILSKDSDKKSSPDTDDVSQAETATCESNATGSTPEFIMNLPKKPILTVSEQIMAGLDTMSFISDVNDLNDTTITNFNETVDEKTLEKTKEKFNNSLSENLTAAEDELLKSESPVRSPENSLPTSPITGDTLNRTSELLNSTLDISPIAEKAPVEAELNTENIESVNPVNVMEEITRPQLDIIKNKQRQDTTPRLKVKSRIGLTRSPSVARIKRIMCMTSSNPDSIPLQESSNEESEDILTFTREIPSPLAVPKTGILKRKQPETEEHYSPAAKRKRVNFSDPCTTSKKVFIKEPTAVSDSLVELFKNYDNIFDEDIEKDFDVIFRNGAEEQNDLLTTEEPTMEIGAEVNIDCSNETVEDVNVPETPQNISEQLNGDFSFLCPELLVCAHEISCIVNLIPTKQRKLFDFLLKHNLKNVKKISDLAEMTEPQFLKATENNTELFKVIHAVLYQYYETNGKCTETDSNNEMDQHVPEERTELNEETVRNMSLEDTKKLLLAIKTVYGEDILGNELSNTYFVNKLQNFELLNDVLLKATKTVQLRIFKNLLKDARFLNSLLEAIKE